MKVKVSDFVADFLSEHGIRTVFTVVGGGAMHLNDSLGHHPHLRCVYNHHEQASAMAAEAYFRVNNEMAGVCVTSGPGAINALNGVAGAFQDSIPMIVISGQTKTALMTRNSGLDLRTLGNQEFDIISALGKMTKYSETVMRPEDIRYCMEKAFFLALNGRPAPCWIEVPVDIQGALIDTETLRGCDIESENLGAVLDSDDEIRNKIALIYHKLKNAKRPVLYAGNGVRISGGKDVLCKLAEKFQVPVVTCWDSIDLMESAHPFYVGRAGIMGDRPGNFAVQNSDLVLAIGNRLNIYQVGYQPDTWAREAFVIDIDIDELELKKPTIRVDLPLCCDAARFMTLLLSQLENDVDVHKGNTDWIARCRMWKEKYPVVQKKHYIQETPLNVYAFIDSLSRALPEGTITVAANGSASVVGSAAYYIKENQRFIMNCAMSSMGYDLPAAIGTCIGSGNKAVICIAGDGSIMMNIQEMQTIVTNYLPVKIVLINNQGYQQIRLTQTNLFQKNFVGIGPDSNDLGFPDFGKVAYAFGLPYRKCENITDMNDAIQWVINEPGYCLLDACCSTDQIFEPKSAAKRLTDGSLYSPPLEDLAPFLSRDELKENMVIDLLDENRVALMRGENNGKTRW